jgi:hypothetical protein
MGISSNFQTFDGNTEGGMLMKIHALAVAALLSMAAAAQAEVKSVVLVHGAFADGSGWRPVAKILEHDGYAVQN